MEEKKISEKNELRAKKRRRTQIFRLVKVITGLVAVLAVILYLLCALVFFKIDTIDVAGIIDENGNITEGSNIYTDEEIIRISGVNTGDSLVLISKSNIEDAIEKLLPYIGNVRVQRKYPSTLKLTVEDTYAAYALDEGGGYILLNNEFKVLEMSEKIPSGCAKVAGIPVVSSEAGIEVKFNDEGYKNRINSIVDAFNNAELFSITKIDISNIANVKVTVDGRFTMVLGTLTQLREKLSIGIKTINAETAENPDAKIIIDLTDPDRAYVRNDYSPDENTEETSEITDDDSVIRDETPEEIPEETPEEIPEETPEEIPEAVG